MQALIDVLIASVDLFNILNNAFPFCAKGSNKQGYTGPDIWRAHGDATQLLFASQTNYCGAVRIAEDYLGAHIDELIDEVELFDRALTGTEILSLYNAGASGKTITISFDVKPGNGDDADPINLGSMGKTPVAILSTETFDATTVDIGSVRFAGAMVSVKKNGEYHASYEDVNDDGLIDLVLHFDTQSLQLSDSSTETTLSGVTASGRCISGTDEIVIVPRS